MSFEFKIKRSDWSVKRLRSNESEHSLGRGLEASNEALQARLPGQYIDIGQIAKELQANRVEEWRVRHT